MPTANRQHQAPGTALCMADGVSAGTIFTNALQ